MALYRFPPTLNDFAYGCLHPLPDPGRLSRAVQDHGNIGFCHAKFRRQISVGNVLVVHLANETACPLFRQKYHPPPVWFFDCGWEENAPVDCYGRFPAAVKKVVAKANKACYYGLAMYIKHLTREDFSGVWLFVTIYNLQYYNNANTCNCQVKNDNKINFVKLHK